jgi:RND family efflux transporter MFP subunit
MSPFSSRAAGTLALTWVLLSAVGCRRSEDAGDEAAEPLVTVEAVVVEPKPFDETVGAIGVVTPQAGHLASLSAPGPARVSRVLVTGGQHVTKGQVLIELEQTTFRAAVEGAEAGLAAARQAYDRAKRLADEGVGPRKDVEQATAELARARAEAINARRAAELAVLRAPLAGVVTRMDATLGASVDANQTLVEVADPSGLDSLLNVTPAEAARIRPAAAVTFTAGQRTAGEPLGTGAVVDVAGTVDSATRSVAVRARAPRGGRPLRIGETVFGQIVVATLPSAITVPLAALVPEASGFKVFVVDSAGTAHARPVEVGARTDSTALIRKGLAVGELVVTAGAYGVADSARVSVKGRSVGPAAAGEHQR